MAVRPKERRYYFRHHGTGECAGAFETMLHLLAKEVLEESASLRVPEAVAHHGKRLRHMRDEWNFEYHSVAVEQVRTGAGAARLRPDVVLNGLFKGKPCELLVEIFVKNRCSATKRARLREQRISAVEIDLSRLPRDGTREFYKDAILAGAERRWLYNNLITEGERILCEEAERYHGGIGAKVTSAYGEVPVEQPGAWVREVEDAGLGELLGLEIDGHGCFAVVPAVWQAALLYRYVLTEAEEGFDIDHALRWLDDQGLLKDAFRTLLQRYDRDRLEHLKAFVPGFRAPQEVVADYAGEMVRRGHWRRWGGRRGWQVPQEMTRAAGARRQEVIRWRLRTGHLLAAFQEIRERASRGSAMDWETWRSSPLAAHQGQTPEHLVVAAEPAFRALLNHLRGLLAMFAPAGAVPANGLLGLPLEPEREARLAEQRAASAAERARHEAVRREHEAIAERMRHEAAERTQAAERVRLAEEEKARQQQAEARQRRRPGRQGKTARKGILSWLTGFFGKAG